MHARKGVPMEEEVGRLLLCFCAQELKKKQFEQQRKQAAKDIRLSAYTAEADLKVGLFNLGK